MQHADFPAFAELKFAISNIGAPSVGDGRHLATEQPPAWNWSLG